MKHLIVYDSQYGNTKKIAVAITNSLPQAKALQASEASQKDLQDVRTLVVGSPTQGGRPTKAIQDFIDQIPKGSLKGIKVAAFDTGFKPENLNFALKLLVKTIGYASPKIAQILESKGGTLLLPAKTFIVTGKEGPLAKGEIELASRWLI